MPETLLPIKDKQVTENGLSMLSKMRLANELARAIALQASDAIESSQRSLERTIAEREARLCGPPVMMDGLSDVPITEVVWLDDNDKDIVMMSWPPEPPPTEVIWLSGLAASEAKAPDRWGPPPLALSRSLHAASERQL